MMPSPWPPRLRRALTVVRLWGTRFPSPLLGLPTACARKDGDSRCRGAAVHPQKDQPKLFQLLGVASPDRAAPARARHCGRRAGCPPARCVINTAKWARTRRPGTVCQPGARVLLVLVQSLSWYATPSSRSPPTKVRGSTSAGCWAGRHGQSAASGRLWRQTAARSSSPSATLSRSAKPAVGPETRLGDVGLTVVHFGGMPCPVPSSPPLACPAPCHSSALPSTMQLVPSADAVRVTAHGEPVQGTWTAARGDPTDFSAVWVRALSWPLLLDSLTLTQDRTGLGGARSFTQRRQ